MNFIESQTLERGINLLSSLKENPSSPSGSDSFLGLSQRDLERYSLLAAIDWKMEAIARNIHGLSWSGRRPDGIEAEAHKALVAKLGEPLHQGTILIPSDVLHHKRDLNAATAGAGGFVVGTSMGSFIEMLKAKSVTSAMGVQRVQNQRDNAAWAKQTGGPTVVWQANETVPATETTPSFVQMVASPKTAIAYHEVSRQAINQISPAGEQLFRAALADGVALAGDQAVIAGTGASGQPTGIISTAGIGTVNGASMDYPKLVEFQTDVNDANAVLNPNTLGYVAPPATASLLKGRQRFTGTDSPLWRGQIAQGEIEGCRAMSSKQMPAATILFGDWSTVFILEWGALAIEVNPFADFKAGIVGIRAVWSMDVIVSHPQAFSLATSVS